MLFSDVGEEGEQVSRNKEKKKSSVVKKQKKCSHFVEATETDDVHADRDVPAANSGMKQDAR